jgi:sulfonate transport system substrate-binding protein
MDTRNDPARKGSSLMEGALKARKNHKSSRMSNILLQIGLAVLALAMSAGFFACNRTDQKPPGPPEKVTIAYSITTDAALAIVAQMQGYYREERLETTARLHPYGKLALQDVLEGKADFATVAETPVMFAIMKGEQLSIIATIQTTGQNNAIIARNDRGVRTLRDLKGRKIAATPGTTSEYFLDAILGLQGISRKDVIVRNLKADEIPAALARGDIDAASAFSPYTVLTQKKLGGNGITFYEKDIYTSTFNVVATQDFIRQNPGKVTKLLRALVKAEEFVKSHPAEAQKIVADFSGIDIAVVREFSAGSNFGVSLDQSLILALEEESQWALKDRLTGARKVPNYLDFIYFEGLKAVKPEAVRILK